MSNCNASTTAQNFLEYVAQNEKHLRRILMKNVTFDPDIFDDVFNDSIIRAYNAITNNNTQIEDFEKYFFITLKWTYVNADNANRKRQQINVRGLFDNSDFDLIDEEATHRGEISKLYDKVIERFGKNDADIFFDYYSHKTQGVYSFKKLAKDTGRTVSDLRKVIKDISIWVRTECKSLYCEN